MEIQRIPYEYRTSLFKRHTVCKSIKLSQIFAERVEDIMRTVNKFAEIYNMSEKHADQLILESVRYSYESTNDLIPEEVIVVQEINKILENENTKNTNCLC